MTATLTHSGMTATQKANYERDGFLVLRGVLSPEEVEHYLAVVDSLAQDFRAERNLGLEDTVEIRNAVARNADLLPLLDHPAAFPLMLDVMGWNIQLTTSHVFVRTANPEAAKTFKAIDWHADGPYPHAPTIPTPSGPVSPLLYAKIGYFLTDLSQPDSGNLRVVPGSHRLASRPENDPETGEPRGAIQVLTQPGDAVLFENRTWHAVGPNYSGLARKNIYLGYCHRWIKPIDYITQAPELLAQATPVQRQLLGEVTEPLSYYLPGRYPGDTPLQDLAR